MSKGAGNVNNWRRKQRMKFFTVQIWSFQFDVTFLCKHMRQKTTQFSQTADHMMNKCTEPSTKAILGGGSSCFVFYPHLMEASIIACHELLEANAFTVWQEKEKV